MNWIQRRTRRLRDCERSSMTMAGRRITNKNEATPSVKRRPHSSKGEDGFAMLFVIFAIMIIGILGAMTLLYTTLVLRNSVGVTPASRALTAAETGLDVAHALLASEEIEDDYNFPGDIWDGKGHYDVEVFKDPNMGDGDPYDWRITSTGTYTETVEGVNRTFYRELEEVISFAGGRYYNALDYVLFSKEGDIRVDLDGELGFLSGCLITVDGNMYAGDDITLADTAQVGGVAEYRITGDVFTEYGDINVTTLSAAVAAFDVDINGSLYSGILNTGGEGGGVDLDATIGIGGGATIDIVGDINANGNLKDYDCGVRLNSLIGLFGGTSIRIAGTIRSDQDVLGENGVFAAALDQRLEVLGNIHSGGDVTFASSLLFAGNLTNRVNGSIYAGGDVYLDADAFLAGKLCNEVGGDIHAGGDVEANHNFGAASNNSRYLVEGDIYGDNVTLYEALFLGGNINSEVRGNIYCRNNLDIDAVMGLAGTARLIVNGSIYTANNASILANAAFLANSDVQVKGGVAGMDPPGLGIYSGGNMTLQTIQGFSTAYITITGDGKQTSGEPTRTGARITATGDWWPPVAPFSVPSPTPPEPPSPYSEVLMPECDFDYYRQMAKGQEDDDGETHYYNEDTTLDMSNEDFTSTLHVVFVDGNLTIGTIDVPVATKGVFVATGDIYLQDTLRTEELDTAEFQLISNGKVEYGPGFNFDINDGDRMFIYAGHEDYDPDTDPTSVQYELGWFREVEGQITARGDIEISSNPFAFQVGLYNHRISFRNPSVLGEAFRIPFSIKSWKEL